MTETKKPTIGFIGQGFIGKNYADDFERRGFAVVRYALEAPFNTNKEEVGKCDIVFIAVPTPTTEMGFDSSIVEAMIEHVGDGKIAVIKSTILPGTVQGFQKKYPNKTVLYSPEFLSESTAAHDAAHPFSNIVGVSANDAAHHAAAQLVHYVLPKADFTLTCSSTEAELIKYSHNVSAFTQIITFNILYDLSQKIGSDWSLIEKAMENDPLVSGRYAHPVHKSGRGAGGHCFIKDFAAFKELYDRLGDSIGSKALKAFEDKNIDLLKKSNKDLELLYGVYGDSVKD